VFRATNTIRKTVREGKMKSLEQQARDMLEHCGWEEAQSLTACDVCEIANLLQNLRTYEAVCKEHDIDVSKRIIGSSNSVY